jgi:uncharacterized cupin superfamily protein
VAQNRTGKSDAERPSFVGLIDEIDTEMGEGIDRYRIAALGSELGLVKFGVNHGTLFPGGRSSKPHAHSKEEEFVLVLEGQQPTLWIDGRLTDLSPGDAVAFPAGTGIAHTFINNSLPPVKLLIVGERCADDQVHYPVNPETLYPRPWKDVPTRALGPHRGVANE